MESRSPLKNQILAITYGILLICFLAMLYFARSMVIVSIVGIGIGVLVSPILEGMRRRYNMPRALSAFCLFVLFGLFVAGVGYGIVLVAAEQLAALIKQGPQIIERLSVLATTQLKSFPWFEAELESIHVSEYVQTGLKHLSTGVMTGVGVISGFLFAILIGLYTAVGHKGYYTSVIEAFPQRMQSEADGFFGSSASALRQWFRAQLIDMVIVGVLTAVGLWVVGAPYWALFGLLTAVFGIIPYIGILLLVGAAALVVLASDPSLVPWVLGIFFLVQQIEGNIILPLVMKGQAGLPEVPLLIFMLLLGSWLGLVGVFIAPPLLAVLRVAYRRFYLETGAAETAPEI